MAKSWVKRLWKYLSDADYDKRTATLVVVTPLAPNTPQPKPFSVMVPVGEVVEIVRKPAKRARKRAKK